MTNASGGPGRHSFEGSACQVDEWGFAVEGGYKVRNVEQIEAIFLSRIFIKNYFKNYLSLS